MPNVISRKNTISIEYELNDLEVAIMEILNKYPSTVHQIKTILKFQGLKGTLDRTMALRLVWNYSNMRSSHAVLIFEYSKGP
jgi:hypothetical protein